MQLGEIGIWRAGPETERHWNTIAALVKLKNGDLRIAERLPDLLTNNGFKHVTVEDRTIPLYGPTERADNARRTAISTFIAMKTAVLRTGGLGAVRSEEDYDGLLISMGKEWIELESAGYDFRIVYAQKPIHSAA